MLLKVENLHRIFSGQAQPVLRDVSLILHRGESVALTGESGSGKSTLLHLIGALDRADGGRISLDSQDITALDDRAASALRRSRIALIFQQFNLVPALTVEDNIGLHARLGKRFDPEWTDTLIARLALRDILHRYPEEISGGQQQRVAIARAMAVRPDLLLADEPTGNLDEQTSVQVLTLLHDLVAQSGCTLFMVTHSLQIASTCTRHLHLRDGTVEPVRS